MANSSLRWCVVPVLLLSALWGALGCGRVSDDSEGEGAGGGQGNEGGTSTVGGNGGSGPVGGTGGMGAGTGGTVPEPGCAAPSGMWVSIGMSIPAGDGCNTCTCLGGPSFSCTQKNCGVCEILRGARDTALEEAKRCNPALAAQQCTVEVSDGLECGCPTFANPANADAFAKMKEAEAAFTENACGRFLSCLPCQETLSARCSPEGRCEDLL